MVFLSTSSHYTLYYASICLVRPCGNDNFGWRSRVVFGIPRTSSALLSPSHLMAATLTMTMPPARRSASSDRRSQRSSGGMTNASFQTAPMTPELLTGAKHLTDRRTSLSSTNSSVSAARNLSSGEESVLASTPGTDAINPIHILSQVKQNGLPEAPPEEFHVLKVGPNSVNIQQGPIPEPLLGRASKALPHPFNGSRHNAQDPVPFSEEPATLAPMGENLDPSHSLRSSLPEPSRKTPTTVARAETFDSPTVASFKVFRPAKQVNTALRVQPVASTSTQVVSTHVPEVDIEAASEHSYTNSPNEEAYPSNSLPSTSKPNMGEIGYLHPSSAANSHPARRNTIGSTMAPPSPISKFARHQSSLNQPHASSSTPTGPIDVHTDALDADILEQYDQIRRERNSKRAKAHEHAEAAMTRKETEASNVLVGNLIGEDHVNYVLMYNMLTGIRVGVSRCQAKIKRTLTDEDFTARHKFSFDM